MAEPQFSGQALLGSEVLDLDVAPDGSMVTVALADGHVKQWHTVDRRVADLGAPTEAPTKVQGSSDGSVVVAAAGPSATLFVRGAATQLPSGVGPIAVSPSGRRVVYLVDVTAGDHDIGDPFAGAFDIHLVAVGGRGALSDNIVGTIDRQPDSLRLIDDHRLVTMSDRGLTAGGRTPEIRTFTLDPFSQTSRFRMDPTPWWDFLGYLTPSGAQAFNGTKVIPTTAGDTSSVRWVGAIPAGWREVPTTSVSPDGSRVAWAESGKIVVSVTASTPEKVKQVSLLGGSTAVTQLRFADNNTLISSSGTDLRLWDLRRTSTTLLSTVAKSDNSGCPRCVPGTLSPNQDGTSVAIQPATAPLAVVDLHAGSNVTLDPEWTFLDWRDGSRFFAVRHNEQFDAPRTDPIIGEFTTGSARPISEFPLSGLTSDATVYRGAWSPSAGRLFIVTYDGELALDPESGILTSETKFVSHLSEDGQRMVVQNQGSDNARWQVKDTVSGQILKTFKADDLSIVDDLYFVGGHQLVRGTIDQVVVLGDDADSDLTLHPGILGAVQESMDGGYLVSGRDAHSIELIAPESGVLIQSLPMAARGTSTTLGGFSGDSSSLFLLDTNSDLRRLDLRPAIWLDQVCASVGRGLTPQEWTIVVGDQPPAQLACA